jgi:hypothetical protein
MLDLILLVLDLISGSDDPSGTFFAVLKSPPNNTDTGGNSQSD